MNETCWGCGKPAVWRLIGEKQGPPIVLVEFYACEKCVPFAVLEYEKENAHVA